MISAADAMMWLEAESNFQNDQSLQQIFTTLQGKYIPDDQLLTEFENVINQHDRSKSPLILLHMANLYIQRNDPDSAAACLERIRPEQKSDQIQSVYFWLKGILAWQSENSSIAHGYWKNARKIFRELLQSVDKIGFNHERDWQNVEKREKTLNHISRSKIWYQSILREINQHMIFFPEECAQYLNQFIAAGFKTPDFPFEIFEQEYSSHQLNKWVNPDSSFLSPQSKYSLNQIIDRFKLNIPILEDLIELSKTAQTSIDHNEKGELLFRSALLAYQSYELDLAEKLAEDAMLEFPPYSHQKVISRWMHGTICWFQPNVRKAAQSWKKSLRELEYLRDHNRQDHNQFEEKWYTYYLGLFSDYLDRRSN